MKKIILITIMLFIIGCSSVSQQIITSPLPDEYEELGESSCKSCSFLLFGFIPIRFSVLPQRAYNCAVQSKNGDYLLNPTLSESWYWAYIGNLYCTKISGMVIKEKQE